MNAVKVIAVDYGGVLFSNGRSVYEVLEKEYGYNPKLIQSLLTRNEMKKSAHTGKISDEVFWEWVKSQLPTEYDVQIVRKKYYEDFRLDKDIFELIQRLKTNYQIIAFSGNMRTRVDYLDQKYDIRRIFDKEVFSFDCGYTKPEKEFVQKMITVAGCLPEEIVYIDDNEEAARVAEDLGVKAVIYERGKIDRLVKDLVVLGMSI